MKISEFDVAVERKAIKNIHLAVYPPDGRVHLSVPEDMREDDISDFLYTKLSWIREKYQEVIGQERQTDRKFVSGENHYLLGNRYLLRVIPTAGAHEVLETAKELIMHVHTTTTIANRQALLNEFYRTQLYPILQQYVTRWAAEIGESEDSFTWSILSMRQQWGSCSTPKRSIRFNLHLARVPMRCIEYVVVHELVHLKVHEHNQYFRSILTKFLPDWSSRKMELDNFIALPIEN